MAEAEKNSPFSAGFEGKPFEIIGRIDNDGLDNLLRWATSHKVSDVTITSGQPVWLDVGGRNVRGTSRALDGHEVNNVIAYIYGSQNAVGMVASGEDLDPSYQVRTEDGFSNIRFRVNVTKVRYQSQGGASITIRTLPGKPLDISKLGVEDEIMASLRPPQGLIYVTGPTGSGKSTLMASIIRHICEDPKRDEKVIEFSKPIEFVYDGLDFPHSHITQSEVGRDLRARDDEGGEGNEWSYAVRNALRRKPTLIVVGEARDKPTIRACIEAALTGHLVYSTIHTIGVPETIRRAIAPFSGSEQRGLAIDLLESLAMVVTQLLVPKVGGGKVPIREYMIFDAQVRRRLADISHDEWPATIRDMLAKQEVVGQSMSVSAQRQFEAGLIARETRDYYSQRSGGR